MPVPANVASLHERFRSALTKRYFVRLHMTVMILLVLLSGMIASRLLLFAGVSHMGHDAWEEGSRQDAEPSGTGSAQTAHHPLDPSASSGR